MSDDFLDARDSSAFLDELIAEDEEDDSTPPPTPKRKGVGSAKGQESSSGTGFLGMTPVQTFIISAMFFFIVLLLGFLLLMFTGKMVVTF